MAMARAWVAYLQLRPAAAAATHTAAAEPYPSDLVRGGYEGEQCAVGPHECERAPHAFLKVGGMRIEMGTCMQILNQSNRYRLNEYH